MEGYVKNISSEWAYAMKRSIKPGGEIPLKELYVQYGKKYEMRPGDEFVDWLFDIKLKDKSRWKLVYTNDNPEDKIKVKLDTVPVPLTTKGLKVEDVVNFTVREARSELRKVTDLNLLKYSLQEANQLSNKDTLCNLLRKRIQELQIQR